MNQNKREAGFGHKHLVCSLGDRSEIRITANFKPRDKNLKWKSTAIPKWFLRFGQRLVEIYTKKYKWLEHCLSVWQFFSSQQKEAALYYWSINRSEYMFPFINMKITLSAICSCQCKSDERQIYSTSLVCHTSSAPLLCFLALWALRLCCCGRWAMCKVSFI